MAGPKRIQRKRTKDSKLPEGAVYVGRPTKWGNPFIIGQRCDDSTYRNAMADGRPLARQGVVEDQAHAVELFTFWLMAKVPYTAADIRRELEGKDLACWCKPGTPCHADVLLDLANEEPA